MKKSIIYCLTMMYFYIMKVRKCVVTWQLFDVFAKYGNL